MYGKHFESMYEGSMYGAGIAVFAVWGYVISHAHFGRVELNPKKLADTLGGKQEEIEAAIEYLQRADSESRNKEHEGRRMIKEGEFQYFLPSWKKYQTIRNAEERREYNRVKQAESRKARNAGKTAGEVVRENVARIEALEAEKGRVLTVEEWQAESPSQVGAVVDGLTAQERIRLKVNEEMDAEREDMEANKKAKAATMEEGGM